MLSTYNHLYMLVSTSCWRYFSDVFFYTHDDSFTYALLILGVDQSFAFPRVADETGFNQYCRHLGTQQNIKRCLFDPFVLNPAVTLIFQVSHHRNLYIAGKAT